MSDLINRRDAIDAINSLPDCPNGYSDTYDKARIIGVIEDLPSADVRENVRGEWIEDRYQDYSCACSVCETTQDIKAKFMFSFCPNCGADMREWWDFWVEKHD